MKKYTFILVGVVLLTMTACGNGSTTNQSTDSTETQVQDSTAVVTDSTSVEETTELAPVQE
jgi:hypothetical protein